MTAELALTQLDAWLTQRRRESGGGGGGGGGGPSKREVGLEIVGVYFANAHADNITKLTAALLVAHEVAAQASPRGVLLCQVVNDRIQGAFDGKDSCLDFYQLRAKGHAVRAKDWEDADDILFVASEQGGRTSNDVLAQGFQGGPRAPQIRAFADLRLKEVLEAKADDQLVDFEDHLDDVALDWRNLDLACA